MVAASRAFGSAVMALARPFWVGDERWRAWGLLSLIVAMALGLVYVNVLFSNWNNRFYDALQLHDFARFLHELAYFCWLAVAFIVVAVYQTYLTQMLEIQWRRWLTDQYLGEWLRDDAYFHLQLGAYRADNPDQRIAEDLRLFVGATLNLSIGLLSSVVTLESFAIILWRLSGTLELPVATYHIAVPGYMLWAALLYAIGGTWLTHRIGRPLIGLNFQQQQLEADFRFSLVRLRENAEGVALYRGEPEEMRSLRERFAGIVANWWAIMRRQKRLTWFTARLRPGGDHFSRACRGAALLRRAIQLGGLMQTAQAFGQVQSALSWFVTAYMQLAQWKATTDRLTGSARDRGSKGARGRARDILAAAQTPAWRSGTSTGAAGRTGCSRVPASNQAGEAWLSPARPASGRALLRAIAGIWPFGHGSIAILAGRHAVPAPEALSAGRRAAQRTRVPESVRIRRRAARGAIGLRAAPPRQSTRRVT